MKATKTTADKGVHKPVNGNFNYTKFLQHMDPAMVPGKGKGWEWVTFEEGVGRRSRRVGTWGWGKGEELKLIDQMEMMSATLDLTFGRLLGHVYVSF